MRTQQDIDRRGPIPLVEFMRVKDTCNKHDIIQVLVPKTMKEVKVEGWGVANKTSTEELAPWYQDCYKLKMIKVL